jgi:vacuolar-type H+-ATPase subunit C/Vma6
MSDYDYGNARLRAMKSRLLSRLEIEALANVDNIKALIAALTKSAYRKSVEAALARSSGMDCITTALHDDLIHTIGKVRGFYHEQAEEMISIVLRTYDIYNLKAILRGLEKNAPPGEILAVLLPIGDLSYGILGELARAPNSRACADQMASMGLTLAQPLLKLRAKRPGAEVSEMELAIERWHYQEAFQTLQRSPRDGRVLFSALQLEADLTNLFVVLRFTHAPSERKFLRQWLGADDFDLLFVGPGRLSFSMLARAGKQDTVQTAVETLSETPYTTPLKAGLVDYIQFPQLSKFEKHLLRFRLEWMSNQISQDPLGIGVLLGYLALKVNEVKNIRWIAQAKSLGYETKAVTAELV